MNPSWTSEFALWGIACDWGRLSSRLSSRLGITPSTWNIGTMHLFFHASCGEIAESDEAIAFQMGFVRNRTLTALSVQQMLVTRIVQPGNIDIDTFRGNALVACISKMTAQFTVYQTLMAMPQLYYMRLDDGGLVCATHIHCLLALLDEVQINPDVLPMHMMFRLVPGPQTYFHHVRRLFPGQMLKWHNGHLVVSLARDLRLAVDRPTYDRLDTAAVEAWYEQMGAIMGAYLASIGQNGGHVGNLLSGGVDSSLLQLLINEHWARPEQPPSFSFAVQAADFQFEIEYARAASQQLDTRHTFIPVTAQEYPDLLQKTIEILGHPGLYNESIPCNLALAAHVASDAPQIEYFIAGQAADALYGVHEARKIALLQIARRIPGSRTVLQILSALLSGWAEKKAHGLGQVADMLAQVNTPHSLLSPTNYVAVATDLDWMRRCFDDQTLTRILDYRLDLETDYLDSASILEKTQVIDLLTAGYEPAVVVHQLFASWGRQLVQFYLDEEVIRAAMAFSPRVRFLKGLNTKPLPKMALTRHSCAVLTQKGKGGTAFNQDLYAWMKQGVLQDMVRAVERPSFLSQSDFEQLIEYPDCFLWNVLTWDLFVKWVRQNRTRFT